MKKKKAKKSLNKKDKIIIVLLAIILGFCSYLLGTNITKKYLDKQKKESEKIDFSEMSKLETIKNISLTKLLENYNNIIKEKDLESYQVNSKNLEKKDNLYEYTTNGITFVFQTDNKNVSVMSIYYKEESDTTKEIIKAFLKANNNSLEDDDIKMIYDSVIRTRDNEEKDNSKTSEYFQYKGIEANLKETINGDKSIYQFRIGRITEQLIIIILFLCFHTLYRKEVYLCLRNALTLDERENLIYFTRIGAYKVSIVLYGYCKLSGQSFDEKKDFISIGLRQLNTDNIYVGASQWIYNEKTLPVIAQGIITVNDDKTPYELVNLSKKTIYLKTPDIANINTNSYFANAPVTIIIDEINSKKS